MTCKLCQGPKNWNGDDRKCAFDNPDFDNWNCGTINKLRDICMPDGWNVSGKDGVHVEFLEDQKYATINTDDIDDMGYCLWLTWYKRRGRTEEVYLLGNRKPRHPTEEECLKVIAAYGEQI